MFFQFNLSLCFTVVLTRISSVFEELISRPAFLDSFHRSSSFLHGVTLRCTNDSKIYSAMKTFFIKFFRHSIIGLQLCTLRLHPMYGREMWYFGRYCNLDLCNWMLFLDGGRAEYYRVGFRYMPMCTARALSEAVTSKGLWRSVRDKNGSIKGLPVRTVASRGNFRILQSKFWGWYIPLWIHSFVLVIQPGSGCGRNS
jgi:hypothetical protein